MARINDARYRVLSIPHDVIFAGFRSTTTELQANGWKLAVQEDCMQMRVSIAMQHDCGISGFAEEQEYRLYLPDAWRDKMTFVVNRMVGNDQRIITMPRMNFQAFDATPTFQTREEFSIRDLGFFAKPLVRTEEIILEPQSVEECLEFARKLQAVDLADIRARRRRNEAIMPHNFHAQLITMAA